jgi:hypothetical protein
LVGRSKCVNREAPKYVPRVKRIAGGLGAPSCSDLGEGMSASKFWTSDDRGSTTPSRPSLRPRRLGRSGTGRYLCSTSTRPCAFAPARPTLRHFDNPHVRGAPPRGINGRRSRPCRPATHRSRVAHLNHLHPRWRTESSVEDHRQAPVLDMI